MEPLPSQSWKKSPTFLGVGSTNSLHPDPCELMMRSWNEEQMIRKVNSLTHGRPSAQSTKQTKYDTVVPDGQKEEWFP